MNNPYESANGAIDTVPERVVTKIVQIYRKHFNAPGNIEGALRVAFDRFDDKDNIPYDHSLACILALEALAKEEGDILPEGYLRETYKNLVIKHVTKEMLSKDPMGDSIDYWNYPRQRLQDFPLFADKYSHELNSIADAILDDERLARDKETIDPWEQVNEEYEDEE